MNDDYIKQLELANQRLTRRLEESEKTVEDLKKQVPTIVQVEEGFELRVDKAVIARSIGSWELADKKSGKIHEMVYDLQILDETLYGYVTNNPNNHMKEISDWLTSGIAPKHRRMGKKYAE
jgi:hypothetical protein